MRRVGVKSANLWRVHPSRPTFGIATNITLSISKVSSDCFFTTGCVLREGLVGETHDCRCDSVSMGGARITREGSINTYKKPNSVSMGACANTFSTWRECTERLADPTRAQQYNKSALTAAW